MNAGDKNEATRTMAAKTKKIPYLLKMLETSCPTCCPFSALAAVMTPVFFTTLLLYEVKLSPVAR
jgi:hypothetical protein